MDNGDVELQLTSELRLRPVTLADEIEVKVANDEMAEEGFSFAFGLDQTTSFNEYIKSLEDRGRGLSLGAVPETFLLAEAAGAIVGRLSLRHELNEQLRQRGGHIGFGILRRYRRRGYATEILRQGLTQARALSLDRVLLTCDAENTGSRRVIESQGGVYDPAMALPKVPTTRHYWIALE